MMRITGGQLLGRKLHAPTGGVVRPATDMLRVALFNMLSKRTQDARVLDLFAGSGVLSFEALSRGAGKVLFVERSRNAAAVLKRNIERAGFAEQAEVVTAAVKRALALIARRGERFALIFADPPYNRGELARLLLDPLFIEVAGDARLIVVEHSPQEPLPTAELYETVRERVYGDTAVTIIAPAVERDTTTGA